MSQSNVLATKHPWDIMACRTPVDQAIFRWPTATSMPPNHLGANKKLAGKVDMMDSPCCQTQTRFSHQCWRVVPCTILKYILGDMCWIWSMELTVEDFAAWFTVTGLLSRCCRCTNVLVDPGSRSGNWVPPRWDSFTIRSCSTAPWRDLPSAVEICSSQQVHSLQSSHPDQPNLRPEKTPMLFLPSLTGFWKYKQLYMDGLAANHGKTRSAWSSLSPEYVSWTHLAKDVICLACVCRNNLSLMMNVWDEYHVIGFVSSCQELVLYCTGVSWAFLQRICN